MATLRMMFKIVFGRIPPVPEHYRTDIPGHYALPKEK